MTFCDYPSSVIYQPGHGSGSGVIMLFLLAVFTVIGCAAAQTEPKLVCYHTNWAVYRPEPVNLTPKDLDPFMCTHIIYSFAKVINEPSINGYGLAPYEEHDITGPTYYTEFTDLKKVNPDLKTILAVGGWTHASTNFTDMVVSRATRKQFIDHSIAYLRQWNFDGLDLDWEYPCQRGGKSSDKQGYVDLVAELRQAYIAESEASGMPRMTISMAVPAGEYNIDLGYDVAGLSANLDFVNLMAYDLHGQWEWDLGHHTSLFPGANDEGGDKKLTVSYAADKWVRDGCPSGKLIVGLGMYGRHWMVGSSCNINSGANGGGTAGPYTGEKGFWAYYEICTEIRNGMTVTWDDVRKVPYGCDSKHWVGYDNELSLYEKAMFIQDRGLGGGMVWALDLDDYKGLFCDAGPWPLMTQVKKYIRESGYVPPTLPPTTPPPPTTPTMYPPTTPPPYTGPPDQFCNGKADGIYPGGDCAAEYYQCVNGVTYPKSCPSGTVFNPSCTCCDWPSNVPACP